MTYDSYSSGSMQPRLKVDTPQGTSPWSPMPQYEPTYCSLISKKDFLKTKNCVSGETFVSVK